MICIRLSLTELDGIEARIPPVPSKNNDIQVLLVAELFQLNKSAFLIPSTCLIFSIAATEEGQQCSICGFISNDRLLKRGDE